MKRDNKRLSPADQLPDHRKQRVAGPFYTSAGVIHQETDEEEEESKKKSKKRRRRNRGVTSMILLLFSLSLLAQKSAVRTENGDIQVEVLAEGLEHPWGMAFLPDDRLLFSERAGTLRIMDPDGTVSQPLKGVPQVFSVDQGGMLDVALHPKFQSNNTIYFTYAEPRPGDSTATTALGMARLVDNEIQDFQVIFRMQPDKEGAKHFGGRILISPDGFLFVTLAERFKFDPAQDLSNTLGTIVRLNLDGSVPQDNPFAGEA